MKIKNYLLISLKLKINKKKRKFKSAIKCLADNEAAGWVRPANPFCTMALLDFDGS